MNFKNLLKHLKNLTKNVPNVDFMYKIGEDVQL